MEFRTDILKLEIVANMLTLQSRHGYYYIVESVWEDYGAGIMCDTIVGHNPHENPDSILESWKAISPKKREMILNCETPYDFADMVRTIQNDKFFLD